MSNVAIVGPVYPYRAGIAYCTTELAKRLGADVFSFSRQYPRFLYPGGDDIDPTLPRADARFDIDVMNPWTWMRAGWRLRKYDAVIFVWWIWVWALPYRVMMALLPRGTRVILQCHNIGDKEPAWWKRALTNIVLRRGRVLVTHAVPEAAEAWKRSRGRRVVRSFLPVHELGGAIPTREEARKTLKVDGDVALFFGHVRPFKGLDIALRAWRELRSDVTLLVAGEAWWNAADDYRKLATEKVRFDFRFIPDAEIATWFAAADVVLAPYRIEAQSGVALTAFHFARPVIATRVGGLPEIIEEGRNGMLIPPEDPSALAKAVEAFFARSDRAEMERHAAASARKYSWEEYAALFRRLVTGG
ncbi:MAG TPA: glycosyltransferase family 4 protein [Thermoanaerobaculia bacterium]|nr:glycosyltransferase family 4 protein [Thermoanaerobaculia bacterium]